MADSLKSSFQTLVDLGLLKTYPVPQSAKPTISKPPLALKPSPIPKESSSIDLNTSQQSKCSSIKEELKDLLENDTRLKEICREIRRDSKHSSIDEPPAKRLLSPAKAAKLGKLLYERGQEMLSNRNQHAQAIFTREHPFKPHLDHNSLRLMDNPDALRKPLYSPRVIQESSSTAPEESKQTLTPKRLKKFISRNYNTQMQKLKGRISKTEEKLNAKDLECTFTPRLNERTAELASTVCINIENQRLPIPQSHGLSTAQTRAQ